ncbi:hypothetical protein WA577_007698, partial [Blastocystis sp. JDR]
MNSNRVSLRENESVLLLSDLECNTTHEEVIVASPQEYKNPFVPDYRADYDYTFLHVNSANENTLLKSYSSYRSGARIPMIHNGPKKDHYLLVLGVFDNVNTIDRCKNNTLASYAVLMKRWNIKVVYFTTSPVLQEACHKYRIDVIKEHLVNYLKQPLFRELMKSMKQMYKATFYGFADNDLLISSMLGSVLSEIESGSLQSFFPYG